MTEPPPCFTVGIVYFKLFLAPLRRRIYRIPSVENKLNFDLSDHNTRPQSAVDQCKCCLANFRRARMFFFDISGFLEGLAAFSPSALNSAQKLQIKRIKIWILPQHSTSRGFRDSDTERICGFPANISARFVRIFTHCSDQ